MERLIQLDNLNRQEALRYLGSGGQTPDDAFMALVKKRCLHRQDRVMSTAFLTSGNVRRACVRKARILYCAAIL